MARQKKSNEKRKRKNRTKKGFFFFFFPSRMNHQREKKRKEKYLRSEALLSKAIGTRPYESDVSHPNAHTQMKEGRKEVCDVKELNGKADMYICKR